MACSGTDTHVVDEGRPVTWGSAKALALERAALAASETVGRSRPAHAAATATTSAPVLDAEGQQEIRSFVEALAAEGKVVGLTGNDASIQYQVSVLNSLVEYRIELPNGTVVEPDGIDIKTGYLQDAKFAWKERSIYDPPSMNSPFMETIATQKATKQLERYKAAILSDTNPFRGLEIVATDKASAEFFEGLMAEVGVPGYVRVE